MLMVTGRQILGYFWRRGALPCRAKGAAGPPALPLVMFLVVAMNSVAALGAGLVEGLRKYEAGDYEGAIGEWQPLADMGNPDALFNMGQVYRLGRGVAADIERATDYYRRASDAGHAAASGTLATLYYFDDGSRQKRGQAIALWRKAAARGDAPSQYMLAVLHFNGRDVAKDLMQAYAWALLAAESGDDQGQKAARAIRPHLTPNQIVQAEVLKGGLLQAEPPVSRIADNNISDAEAGAEIAAMAEPAAAGPARDPTAGGTQAVQEKAAGDAALPSESAGADISAADSTATAGPDRDFTDSWSLQLGFFARRENVERYWADVSSRARTLLAGLSGRIVTVDRGPERGIFFRLLVGPVDDRAGVEALCGRLKDIGIDCFAAPP